MQLFRSELIDDLNIPVGGSVKLESLRVAVVPPYLMLMPFIKLPEWIVLEEQLALDEDGVHGCIYVLNAAHAGAGEIEIGFQDMQTREVTHSKVITVRAH